MNLKQSSLLLFLSALAVQGQDASEGDSTPSMAPTDFDDDWGTDDADGYGQCFMDDQCLFFCGDALTEEDCKGYSNPGLPGVTFPYFRAPGGECTKIDGGEQAGYCCGSCDDESTCELNIGYFKNKATCEAEGKLFYDKFGQRSASRSGEAKFEDWCDPKDKVGSSSGDPHFKTWTGHKFDYHGECDLVLVDNPTFLDGLGLKLHIRTTRIKYFSYIERIGLQLGNHTLEFANDVDNFLIDGEPVEPNRRFHKTFLAGYLVRRDKTSISVRLVQDHLKTQHSARIDFVQRRIGFPAVVVNSEGTDLFKGSMGLLGDYATGARVARDGKTIMNGEDATAFALEWQVRDTEPMLFKEARYPQYPALCTPPAKMMSTRLGMSHLRAQAEEVCASWKQDKEDCIFDVMATRDIEVAKEGAIKTA